MSEILKSLGIENAEKIEQYQALVIKWVASFGLKIVGAIGLLVLAWWASSWLHRVMLKSFNRTKLDLTLSQFFANSAKWVILAFAVLVCLGIFGVQTTSFAAVIGAAGLAVGLAFQGTLSNFSAGVMLLVFRPFKIGDVIDVSSTTGTVMEIGLFSTAIDTPDNRRFILPNSNVFNSTIENRSFHSERRIDVAVGTAYEADISRTRSVLEQEVQSFTPQLSSKPPQVYLDNLGASSVDWKLRVWTKQEDYWAGKEKLIEQVKKRLDSEGISIPYPQTQLHLSDSEALKRLLQS